MNILGLISQLIGIKTLRLTTWSVRLKEPKRPRCLSSGRLRLLKILTLVTFCLASKPSGNKPSNASLVWTSPLFNRMTTKTRWWMFLKTRPVMKTCLQSRGVCLVFSFKCVGILKQFVGLMFRAFKIFKQFVGACV